MQLPVLDLIVLGIVVLFAFLGARKGLVLSLCSLAAILVAIVGASILTDALAPVLVKQCAPLVEGFISENLDAILAGQAGQESGFLWSIIHQAIQGSEAAAQAAGDFAAQLAVQVAAMVLRPVLFLIAFVLILIVWFFISHALDLVAKLPVLSTLNAAGGLVFGAVEGAALALIAFLLIRAFLPELIPQPWLDGSYLLSLLEEAPLPPLF